MCVRCAMNENVLTSTMYVRRCFVFVSWIMHHAMKDESCLQFGSCFIVAWLQLRTCKFEVALVMVFEIE